MNGEIYEIGETVRIRDWDDMVDEFGLVGDDIYAPIIFTQSMRYLCGTEFIITDKRYNYKPDAYIYEGHNRIWSIVGAMICSAYPEDRMPKLSDLQMLF